MQVGELSSFGFSRKNVVMNGDFNITQRGSSFVNPTTSYEGHPADRYLLNYYNWSAGHCAINTVVDTDVPDALLVGRRLNRSLKLSCATVGTSGTTGRYAVLHNFVEGFYLRPIWGSIATFSFWVKSNKTGTYCIRFGAGGNNAHYVSEYTIDSASTWEKKTITFSLTPSIGTWYHDYQLGLVITFTLSLGTLYQTSSLNTWISGNYFGTSSQVNFVDNTANVLYIAGVQLEKGLSATPFEYVPISEELSWCQRYFEKSYDVDVNPSTTTEAGAVIAGATVGSDGYAVTNVRYKVPKRIVPVRTFYRTDSATTGLMYYSLNGGAWTSGTILAHTGGKDGFMAGFNGKTAGDNYQYFYQWTSDAEY